MSLPKLLFPSPGPRLRRTGGSGRGSGEDNSGDYVYVKNGDGKPKLDKYGHLIVDHDLHNHKGELADGIAEAFIDWAKKEKLSFWKNGK